MKKISLILFAILVLTGCSSLRNVSRDVMGVSTDTLESGKADSIYQVYPCEIGACFDAVIEIARDNNYYIFMKDGVRGLVVLMNIPECVDTTEVGVFLTELPGPQGVRVELSSRSSPAKKAVAKVLFSEMNDRFKK